MRAKGVFSPPYLLLFLAAIKACQAGAPHSTDYHTTDYHNLASIVPECGIGCLVDLSPTSSCVGGSSSSPSNTNTTCVCNRDSSYYESVLSCVQGKCTIEEGIETARGAWEACGKPHRSRKVDLLASLAVEIPALICALLRLYSRWWTVSRFEVDDFVMMAVTVLYIVLEVLGGMAAQSAFGVDIWTVRPKALTLALKLFYISETLYLAILTLTKTSVLCFYLRIFPNPGFRRACHAVAAWVALSGLVLVALQVLQCLPIPFVWEGWKRGLFGPYKCLDINALGFATAASSIAQDVVILVMPLPLLGRLNVSRRRRLGIMVMFSLGFFVLVTSCVRLWTILSFGDSVNPTWDYTNVVIWTGLEVAVSIIVTSLPAIRVLCSPARRQSGTFGSSGGRCYSGHGDLGGGGGGGGRRTSSHGWGGIRGHRGAGSASSTSSFGNTTFVSSMYGPPPRLKRLSALSRISSVRSKSSIDSEKSGNGYGNGGGGGGPRSCGGSSDKQRRTSYSSPRYESVVGEIPIKWDRSYEDGAAEERQSVPTRKGLRRGNTTTPLPSIGDVLPRRSVESLPARLPQSRLDVVDEGDLATPHNASFDLERNWCSANIDRGANI